MTQPPPSVRQVRREVTVELEALVSRALAKAREDRFQSALELAEALSDVGSSSPSRAVVPKPTLASKLRGHFGRVNQSAQSESSSTIPKKIVISHGRSPAWRDLRDLLQDRLGLAWDEFDKEAAAGLTVIERLEHMLHEAQFAFLVMTAEDELASGQLQARQNVVHEAGLFQGYLGFRRAILLVEEGCEQFSNIFGLVQIIFPPGQILARSEEIRRVLEREGILEP